MEHTLSACRQLILAAILMPLLGWTDDLPVPAPGELATADLLYDTAALRIGHLSDVGCYEESWALCDSLQRAFPDHAGPYLYKAGNYVNWMQSNRLSDYEADVDENVKRAIDARKRQLDSSDEP